MKHLQVEREAKMSLRVKKRNGENEERVERHGERVQGAAGRERSKNEI